MPTIKTTSTLAANGQAFPLAGSQFEYLPRAAILEFAVLADALGEVSATIQAGTTILLQSSPLDTKAVAEPIVYPDDFQYSAELVGGGQRISVELRETGGGAPVVRTVVRITWAG
jgi:hypothetical protein